jgi:hypothetical protein
VNQFKKYISNTKHVDLEKEFTLTWETEEQSRMVRIGGEKCGGGVGGILIAGRWYTRDWGGEWRIETFVSYGIKNLNATAQQRTVTEIQGEANDFLMRKVLARAELASQQGT